FPTALPRGPASPTCLGAADSDAGSSPRPSRRTRGDLGAAPARRPLPRASAARRDHAPWRSAAFQHHVLDLRAVAELTLPHPASGGPAIGLCQIETAAHPLPLLRAEHGDDLAGVRRDERVAPGPPAIPLVPAVVPVIGEVGLDVALLDVRGHLHVRPLK